MKANDVCWVNHDNQIKKCIITQIYKAYGEKGASDRYMIKVIGADELMIADSVDDLYSSQEECEVAYKKQYKAEFDAYCIEFGTLEELLSSLLYAVKTKRPIGCIELDAILHVAGEYTNIDMKEYFNQYEEDLQQENKAS